MGESDRLYLPLEEEEAINHPSTFPKISFENPEEYKGWYIWWTGWKDICNQLEIVGQWVAIPLDFAVPQPRLYASTSGTLGVIEAPGWVIDIAKLDCMPWVWCHSSEVDKEVVKEETRHRLMGLIDRRGDYADL